MFEALTQLVEKKKAVDKELKKEGEKALKTVLKEFIKKHPNVKALYWTQYTPYFNDGDECTFRVNDVTVGLSENDENLKKDPYVSDEKSIKDDITSFYDSYSLKDKTELKKNFTELAGLMQDMEDVLKATFGDHVEILVTENNIEVDDYCHD